MARLFAVGLVVGLACASIAYSTTHIASSELVLAYSGDSSADGGNGLDPLQALSRAGIETKAAAAEPVGQARPAGTYRVTDVPVATSSSRRHYRIAPDNDIVPRKLPFRDQVDTGIPPGLYATRFDAQGCSYELSRVMVSREVSVIGQDYLALGRILVDINQIEPDWFSSDPSCGQWYTWSPLPVALTQAGNGDYWVGDLAHGVWGVPEGCRWEKVVSFRGALHDVVDSGAGPEPLIVDPDTFGIRVRGCSPTQPMNYLRARGGT